MRLLIVYNATENPSDDDDPDSISEIAVQDEAQAVYDAALEENTHPTLFPVYELSSVLQTAEEIKPDVIFNLCEGFQGSAKHEMHITSLWELLHIPYTGNTPLTLGLAQDKILTKRLLESKKIHTPPYQVFTQIPEKVLLEFPLIAKPSREDASLGIGANAVAHTIQELQKNVETLIRKYNQPVLVEKYIAGREFNISLMGSPPKVLAISEIDFSSLSKDEPKITSYEAKWMPDHPLYQKTPALCPARVSKDLKQRLEDTAVQVYTLLRGRDYGRVDIRVDEYERIYVLEFNPNPDISPDAGFSKALHAAGIPYGVFVSEMIHNALNRKTDEHHIKTTAC
jgi:D-alanine-D-alanine ligase